jgi:hypothetical protein
VTDDGLEPRDAVLELLLDAGADPRRREELRAIVERDPAALAELAEFERIDDLLRTAGPMVEPSDELVTRVLAVPDEARAESDVPWEAAVAADEPDPMLDDAMVGDVPPPAPEGPTLLADLMPPSQRPTRPERRDRRQRGGFFRSLVVWRAATVVAAAAAIVLGVLVLRDDDNGDGGTQTQATPQTVTIQGESSVSGSTVEAQNAPGEDVTANVVAEPQPAAGDEGQRIHITVDGLDPKGQEVYTVWIARSPARRIAIGTFKPDAQGRIDATVLVPPLPKSYKGIWLTREKPTGVRGWSKDWVFKASLPQQS